MRASTADLVSRLGPSSGSLCEIRADRLRPGLSLGRMNPGGLEDGPGEPNGDTDEYDKMKIVELRTLCTENSLAIRGTKAEIIARLRRSLNGNSVSPMDKRRKTRESVFQPDDYARLVEVVASPKCADAVRSIIHGPEDREDEDDGRPQQPWDRDFANLFNDESFRPEPPEFFKNAQFNIIDGRLLNTKRAGPFLRAKFNELRHKFKKAYAAWAETGNGNRHVFMEANRKDILTLYIFERLRTASSDVVQMFLRSSLRATKSEGSGAPERKNSQTRRRRTTIDGEKPPVQPESSPSVKSQDIVNLLNAQEIAERIRQSRMDKGEPTDEIDRRLGQIKRKLDSLF